ncbi:DoxX family protein [Virgibacillus alimentarius]|uniref:Membrane protein YphA (DoxX/SURF4 family) n=1 Tax=Virgibacillus alimentarius TaxID=698769 RepID=A0ABS4SAE1_9BACI|nr:MULTISPECIES: DoxX family protein [Virgibacillus]MBP2258465.1 putative membrane protein YphA (DoxX/SURF4 family) [Virgibacillus alimentarius]HLR67075.1 DoxX family protein [Virgibacillus sp.]
MYILSIIVQILLGLGFIMFGWMKFTSKEMVDGFNHFGLPQWFRIVTGLFEWIGAIGIIVGIWYPQLAFLSGMWLAMIMFFAILAHVRAKDPISQTKMPAILLVLSLVVVFLNS